MNAEGLRRMMEAHGTTVTLRRMSGTSSYFEVRGCLAAVIVGGASSLVGDVQETMDRVVMTAREMDAAGLHDPPQHGDFIIYANGHETTVQGQADVRELDDGDRVYQLRTYGAPAG